MEQGTETTLFSATPESPLSLKLAYSAEDVADDLAEPDEKDVPLDAEPRFGSTARYALGALLVLITAGAVIVTVALFMAQHRSRPVSQGSPAAPAAPTRPATPSDAPTSDAPRDPAWWNAPLEAVAQHLTLADADAAYLSAIGRAGLVITTPERAIANGHSVCEYLAQGHTPSDAIMNDLAHNPTMSTANARDFIYAAINAYCPQYR